MPAPPDRAFNEWSDISAQFLRSSNWIVPGTTLVGLYAALQNASNANLLYATSGAPIVGTFVPVDALYPSVADLATFNFQTVPGASCQIVLPAPVGGVFGPSADVVDPAAALSVAIIAACVGLLTDSAGNPATAFINGSKANRRRDQNG